MATTSSFAEDLTCSICLDVFDNPLTLPCMHSFCTLCLKDLKTKGEHGRLKCPECRKDAGLDGRKTVDKLPKNYALSNLAVKYKQMAIDKPVPCSMCEGEPNAAVKTCMDCAKMSYCEGCLSQLHPMRGKMKEHRLVDAKSVGNDIQEKRNPRTDQHHVTETYTMDLGTKVFRVETDQKSLQSGVRHPGVTCDGCEGPVFGVRYKCSGCNNYDLCSQCESRGIHSHHNMIKITTPRIVFRDVRHPGVTCDGCEGPVFGVRYKCRGCNNYDLCSKCESRGIHSHHDMIKVITPKHIFGRVVFRLSKGDQRNNLHPHIRCNICDGEVRGIRFSCCECDNYDLCMECEAKGHHSNHDLRKVVKPKHFRNVLISKDKAQEMCRTGVPHPCVTCDSCDGPVRGFRFKCSVCSNYDLCGVCLVQGHHPQHDMRRIDSP